MTEIDTSAEVVARAATALRMSGHHDKAALLAAVVAERDAARAQAERWDTEAAASKIIAADRDRLAARVAELEAHIANIHNRVRHEFSAEVEAAADKAFSAMNGRAALAGSKTDDRR
jgi:hypothetical protein